MPCHGNDLKHLVLKSATILLVSLSWGSCVLGDDLCEQFEGTIFPPSGWTTYTPSLTWINHAAGQCGDGTNTPDNGHGLWLDDYNGNYDGYCMITSPAYTTEGLSSVSFDFAYQYNNGSILFAFDASADAGFAGPYFNIEGGKIYAYNNGWQVVKVGGADMTVNTASGHWQRAVISIVSELPNCYRLTLKDLASGYEQVSDDFTSLIAGALDDSKMAWWTNSTSSIDFAIDNIITQVQTTTKQIDLAGVNPGSDGVIDSATVAKGFLIRYLPSGLGTVPPEGVWSDKLIFDHENYVFNMSLEGGLDQYQDNVSRAKNLQWSVNYVDGGYHHTILGGTIDNFTYNDGNVTARLRCFTTVYTHGTSESFPNGAYQGFDRDDERSGQLTDWVYQLTWNKTTGTGALVPFVLGCDINQDGTVDSVDLSLLLPAMDSQSGDSKFNSSCDLDADQSITSTDLSVLLANMGSQVPGLLTEQKFVSQSYSLFFHANGNIDVYDRRTGSEVLAGTVGRFYFADGGVNTNASGTVLGTIDDATWPQVIVNYQLAQGSATALWTLMPDMAQVKFTVSPASGSSPVDGPATLALSMTNPQLVQAIKPAYWYADPNDVEPYQLTAGMASKYNTGNIGIILANDKGLASLYGSGLINLYARSSQSRYQARGVLSFDNTGVALPLAVASAGQKPLLLNVTGPQPFYLWDNVTSPMELIADVVSLLDGNQTVTIDYTARDYDGQTVAQGHLTNALDPLVHWQVPISITVAKSGPVWLEVMAQSSQGSMTQNLSLGVLPERTFVDNETTSRFGIAAYRGYVGAHTEIRSESQLLGLMRQIGVRGLRKCNNYYLAHQNGFYTWYSNDLTGQTRYDYWAGLPTWCDDPSNRVSYLQSNLQTTLNQGHGCFEFTNEWNLYGGAGIGTLADKYSLDWAIPLKSVRDSSYPSIKLAGCVIANGDLVYLAGVHNAGAWDSFDRLAFHAAGFTSVTPPDSCDHDDGGTYWSYLATLRRIHEAMRQYGSKELWITEFYAPTSPNRNSSNNERVTAEDLTLQIALAIAARVKGFMLHILDDYDFTDEIPAPGQVSDAEYREHHFGLVRRDWTPKATLWAYQTAAYYFDGATFIGDVVMPDPGNNMGMAFSGHNGTFAVLWSRAEGYLCNLRTENYTRKKAWEEFWTQQVPVTLPATSTVTVVNCVGQSYTLTPVNGSVTINLTGAPVYVFGADFTTYSGRFTNLFSETE